MARVRKPFSHGTDRPGSPSHGRPGSLYVHVPFCRRRCRYCDFTSSPYDPAQARPVTRALLAELDRRVPPDQAAMRTAFVGGGTPSVLATRELTNLLQAIARRCRAGAEFSVEANPDSLSDRTLGVLIDAGVNRLSIGVQSFVDGELDVLGWLHSARQARQALERAQRKGFANLSADLIYGIPGQTLQTWQRSLQQVVDGPVTHASCYCLSYPPGTPLGQDLSAGRVAPMDEELQRACYELAIDWLSRAGLRQYEISNFARPGYACKHNINYWQNKAYWGIGPGAVSYVNAWRSTNVSDVNRYVERVRTGDDPTDSGEHLPARQHLAESLMLMLRMRRGVNRRAFARRFGVDPLEAFGEVFRRHVQWGTVTVTSSIVRLTRRGLFVSDSVFADLLARADSIRL